MFLLFLPLVAAGCAAAWLLSDFGIRLVGGNGYAEAVPVFRCLIPVLFFSFFALLLGWPALGAIDRIAETSRSTVYALCFQLLGLLALQCSGHYSLMAVAVLRSITEAVLCGIRGAYVWKNRGEFADMKGADK